MMATYVERVVEGDVFTHLEGEPVVDKWLTGANLVQGETIL